MIYIQQFKEVGQINLPSLESTMIVAKFLFQVWSTASDQY
jgi:hypothetical protein